MNCPRCNGLMLVERFQDVWDDAGDIHFNALHCLVCGEIIDPVIMANRQNQMKPLANRNRKLMAYR
jgi:hypothetical protein